MRERVSERNLERSEVDLDRVVFLMLLKYMCKEPQGGAVAGASCWCCQCHCWVLLLESWQLHKRRPIATTITAGRAAVCVSAHRHRYQYRSDRVRVGVEADSKPARPGSKPARELSIAFEHIS